MPEGERSVVIRRSGFTQPTRYGGVLGNRNYLRKTNYNKDALTEIVKKNEALNQAADNHHYRSDTVNSKECSRHFLGCHVLWRHVVVERQGCPCCL